MDEFVVDAGLFATAQDKIVAASEAFSSISSLLSSVKANFPEEYEFKGEVIDACSDIEEAKSFAAKMNLQLFETSAKTKQGLNEGFSFICNEIYDKLEGKEEPEKIDITKGKKNKKKGGC